MWLALIRVLCKCLFVYYITVGDAIMAINTAVSGDNTEATVTALKSEFLTIEPMDETCLQRYHEALKQAQGEKGEVSTCLEEYSITLTCILCSAASNN